MNGLPSDVPHTPDDRPSIHGDGSVGPTSREPTNPPQGNGGPGPTTPKEKRLGAPRRKGRARRREFLFNVMTGATPMHPSLEVWLTIEDTTWIYGFHKSMFYSWLNDTRTGLAKIIARLPNNGHIRIPASRFKKWFETRGNAGRVGA